MLTLANYSTQNFTSSIATSMTLTLTPNWGCGYVPIPDSVLRAHIFVSSGGIRNQGVALEAGIPACGPRGKV